MTDTPAPRLTQSHHAAGTVHFHHPVLTYENGDEFLAHWYQADAGQLDPFILIVEGSIPDETNKSEGYWAAMGTDQSTASRSRRATGSTDSLRRRGP